MNLAVCDYNIKVGSPKAAIAYLHRVDRLVKEHGSGISTHLYGITDYLISRNLRVSEIYRHCGFPENSIEVAKKCLDQARKDQSIAHMSSAYIELANAYLKLGRHTQAIDNIEESRTLKSDERGTAWEAGAILLLADCHARAEEHNKARSRLDDARALAASSMDRRTLGRATFLEAGLQGRADRERDLLIHCLEEFLDPSEASSPMLFETQRLAVQRLRSIGSLSDSQRRTIKRMRSPRVFRACFSSLLNFDFLPLPSRRPPVAPVWQL